MIVKCINNSADYMPEKVFLFYRKNRDIEFQTITVGKEYLVYAISYHFDHPFYMVCGDDYDGEYVNYPHLLPGCLFEVIDDRYSNHWIEKEIKNDKSGYENTKRVGFKEYVENEYFYGHLLEGYKKEVKQFAQAKELIDKESSI